MLKLFEANNLLQHLVCAKFANCTQPAHIQFTSYDTSNHFVYRHKWKYDYVQYQ